MINLYEQLDNLIKSLLDKKQKNLLQLSDIFLNIKELFKKFNDSELEFVLNLLLEMKDDILQKELRFFCYIAIFEWSLRNGILVDYLIEFEKTEKNEVIKLVPIFTEQVGSSTNKIIKH